MYRWYQDDMIMDGLIVLLAFMVMVTAVAIAVEVTQDEFTRSDATVEAAAFCDKHRGVANFWYSSNDQVAEVICRNGRISVLKED